MTAKDSGMHIYGMTVMIQKECLTVYLNRDVHILHSSSYRYRVWCYVVCSHAYCINSYT